MLNDDWDFFIAGAQLALQLKTAGAPEMNVEHQEIGLVRRFG